jgi:sodium transport system permease protein
MSGKLLGVVFQKEVRDNFRDRRALTMALLVPLLGPAMMALSLSIVAEQARSGDDRPLSLPVAGAEHAPRLVEWLRAHGAEVVTAPADPERAVRAGEVDLVLVLPPEFGERLAAGRPAPAQLVLDQSRQATRGAVERAERLLGAWSHRVGALRLLARGVHPGSAEGLALEQRDLSTPESRAGLLFALLPYFLVMICFMGGMHVAIDTTAGERERLSLEPLLLNPVPRSAVALAKIGATALFAGVALGETVLGFGLLPLLLSPARLGFAIRLDPAVLLQAWLLFLPLLLLVAALMVLVAARARGYKAAQASLSFLMLLPVLPAAFLAMVPIRLQAWMMLVPSLGEQLLLNRLVRGEPVPGLYLALSAGSSLFCAALLSGLAVALFRGEKLLFGR